MDYSKLSIIKNLTWKFMEKIGIQLINIVVQVILTRILIPEDYATVAIIMVFVQLANIVVQSGFGSALVQKKDADEMDFSSVFYLCLVVSFVLYALLFFSAPIISKFYRLNVLTNVLRVQAVILFPCAINTVQVAYLSRHMQFSKNFLASIIACIASGVVGVSLAIMNFGIWAIVACNVSNQIFLTIALWYLVKWRPKLKFSFFRVKVLFSFGWKLLVSSFLSLGYGNIQTLIIGKLFTPRVLGFYNRGELMGTTVMSSVSNAISSVMLPVLSQHQENLDSFKKIYRRVLTLDCFFSFPIMFGLASVAKPLIILLFTEKWVPAVPFMIMVCIARAFDPIHVTNLEAILAVGWSNVTLKLEIIKKTIGILLMLLTFKFGVYAFVASGIILSVISTFINARPNVRAFNYTAKQQSKDILPYLIASIIMFFITFSITFIEMNIVLMLMVQIIVGSICYILLCVLFRAEAFYYVLNNIKGNR